MAIVAVTGLMLAAHVEVKVLLGFRRRIWSTAAVGTAFGTFALYLGLVRFRG